MPFLQRLVAAFGLVCVVISSAPALKPRPKMKSGRYVNCAVLDSTDLFAGGVRLWGARMARGE